MFWRSWFNIDHRYVDINSVKEDRYCLSKILMVERVSSVDTDRNNAIISAILGAMTQVILTISLEWYTQLSVEVAVIAAVPFALFAFGCIWFLLTRISTSKIKPKKYSDETLEGLERIGITESTATLSESGYEPVDCFSKTRTRLYFMGILGSKWMSPAHFSDAFRTLLKRVAVKPSGLVRLLLINPKGDAFQNLADLRKGNISTDSFTHYGKLMDDFPCLEVRLYDRMPTFRLVFIDDEKLVVSRYMLDIDGWEKSNYGWDIPQLVIDSRPLYSLYHSFLEYFDQSWAASVDLKSILPL